METPDLIVFIIFLIIGVIAIAASVFNWDWFFNSNGAAMIVQFLNRKGARIFYGMTGVAIVIVGFVLLFKG